MVSAMRGISVASKPSPMIFDTRLPQPNESFRWVQGAHGPALVCRALEPIVPHMMTTRPWALGSAPGGDERRAWDEIADTMGARLVRIQQVHGADILVRRPGDDATDTLPVAD